VPAYRGTCYMVVPDEDLTELGGAIPQYVFEVERAEGVALTSRPYSLENFDATDAARATVRSSPEYLLTEGTDAAPATIAAGELRDTLVPYSQWPADELDANPTTIVAGELRQTLKHYSQWPAEATDAMQANIQSGELKDILIQYENYRVEATDADSAYIVGGSLA